MRTLQAKIIYVSQPRSVSLWILSYDTVRRKVRIAKQYCDLMSPPPVMAVAQTCTRRKSCQR
jgi:hypothetical protein